MRATWRTEASPSLRGRAVDLKPVKRMTDAAISYPTVSIQRRLIDSLAMIMVSALSISLLLYVGFGEATERSEEIGFDTIEIVFGLGVEGSEDGVRVCFAVHVGDAPYIANDRDVLGLTLPTRHIGGSRESGRRNDESDK